MQTKDCKRVQWLKKFTMYARFSKFIEYTFILSILSPAQHVTGRKEDIKKSFTSAMSFEF